MSKLSLKDAQLTIKTINSLLAKGYKLNGKPSVMPVAATVLGISQRSVRDRIKTAANMHKLVPDTNTITTIKIRGGDGKVEGVPTVAAVPTVEELTTRERQRYSDTIDRLRRELRDAHRTINSGETLKQAVFKLADVEINPPKWVITQAKKATNEVPVLFVSDTHFGEVIKRDQVNGVNEYNIEIAQARYRAVIDRTIKVCRRSGSKFPGIVYARGGDGISGNIHDELRRTNELSCIEQCITLVESESAGISALADEFGHVYVPSVCGNHGREGESVNYKGYVDSNYDYLTSYMLAQKFAADKRVTFYTPNSPDALINILGWNIVFTHGNQISGKGGGTGFIGPSATISKGVFKLRQSYSQVGIYVDMVVLGHFHTSLLGGSHYIANTSLCGFGEYSQSLRVEPEAPGATLFFVDSQVGVGARTVIYAEDPIKNTNRQSKMLTDFE